MPQIRKSIIYLWALVMLAGASSPVWPSGNSDVEHMFQMEAELIVMERAMLWVWEHEADKDKALEIIKGISQLPRVTVYWSAESCEHETLGKVRAIPHEGKCYSGLTWGWNRTYVSVEEHLADTAFVHELSHLYYRLLKGKPDPLHKDKVWWKYWEEDTNKIVRAAEGASNGNQQRIRNE